MVIMASCEFTHLSPPSADSPVSVGSAASADAAQAKPSSSVSPPQSQPPPPQWPETSPDPDYRDEEAMRTDRKNGGNSGSASSSDDEHEDPFSAGLAAVGGRMLNIVGNEKSHMAAAHQSASDSDESDDNEHTGSQRSMSSLVTLNASNVSTEGNDSNPNNLEKESSISKFAELGVSRRGSLMFSIDESKVSLMDDSNGNFSYGGNDDDDDSSEELNADVVRMLRMHQRQCDKQAIAAPLPDAKSSRKRGTAGTRRNRVAISMTNGTMNSRAHSSDMASSLRRSAISKDILDLLGDHLDDLELTTKTRDWLCSFRDLDPRYQILHFFNDLSLEGVDKFEEAGCETKGVTMVPKILRIFIKNGIFSVWRPTSSDAIRKMIAGEGVGKGLDIKGKSAKCGAFSGFVPFLQIHENEHKKKISPMRPNERVRIFYPNKASRDIAAKKLNMLGEDMTERAEMANEIIAGNESRRDSRRMKMLFMGGLSDAVEESSRCLMNDPRVNHIDDYVSTQGVYGLDIPEKLFWEAYVVPNDITRPPGSKYETGRPSMPEFQQMNIDTLRNWSDEPIATSSTTSCEGADPRPVLWHGGCGRVGGKMPEDSDPMCPLSLLIAYEENSKVIPVVSDFDCFLLGTRGVKYHEPFGEQELSMLSMCIEEIEGILATPEDGGNWTQRWLQVKKKHCGDSTSHEMPKFGYADPRSYKIMTGAVQRLKTNGAVRHGPECFNYGFPQDLDDEFLVISDTFPGVPWRYANSEQLLDILSEKIDQGFTFPLNPKWILCDPGWKQLYDKLLASEQTNTQDSMHIWYPNEIRRRIDCIAANYPNGFVPTASENSSSSNYSIGVQADLAQLELHRYKLRLQSTKKLNKAMHSYASARRFRDEVAKSNERLQYMKKYESARTFQDEMKLNEYATKDAPQLMSGSRRRPSDISISAPTPSFLNKNRSNNDEGASLQSDDCTGLGDGVIVEDEEKGNSANIHDSLVEETNPNVKPKLRKKISKKFSFKSIRRRIRRRSFTGRAESLSESSERLNEGDTQQPQRKVSLKSYVRSVINRRETM